MPMSSDLTWYERLRGKRLRDIYLPSERPKPPQESPLKKVKEGVEGFKAMREHLERASKKSNALKELVRTHKR